MFSLRSSCQCVRSFSLGRTLAKNHYDSLGITPTATQADIKDAYYKLSMVYHPDKTTSENDDAVKKFRDITEAYEVLGNVRLRRLYDKGVSDVGDLSLNKFYKSREKRSRPPSTGRSPIYDFDEWSRQHYGVLLRKEQEFKQRVQEHKEAKEHEAESVQMSRIMLVMLLLLAGFSVYMNTGHDHVRNIDKNVTPSNPK
ncbi:hypothetical protein PPYR_03558 [Photinus pyralis]|uniref:J domain-containing protein n=1 Tax=Photinus pyralis TaxID=7054 RepID=A0A1Y1M290_PHOPY|nr:dnaJ homolog subfamily C member 30, mitochondrial-like [Photinus pyralis]XP_031330570.1 dnaJ homolog subfamily C member 30, mitochondrial-like [Photinus pyralis]KAB0791758.1 hypothetical protein PPYR_03558 [Photinus pyralis]